MSRRWKYFFFTGNKKFNFVREKEKKNEERKNLSFNFVKEK